jgi:peptidoglycan/xylan/chitin deacetylase (PgdA/CDA1 family)
VWPVLLLSGWANWAVVHYLGPEFWFVDALGALGLVLFVVGAGFAPQWQLFGAAVSRNRSRPDAIALTFDDGPHPEFTPRVLDLLDAAGARATFFVVGRKAEEHPAIAREILRRGHQLGFHGHTHRWSLMMSPAAFADDYSRGMDAVYAAAGVLPRFFRPPVGLISPPVFATIRIWAARVAAWAVRPYDGGRAPPETIVSRVLSKVQGGDIVLLHDSPTGRSAGEEPSAVSALPGILRGLAERGLSAVTLSELVEEPPYLEKAMSTPHVRPRRSILEWATVATILLLVVGAARGASAADSTLPVDLRAACVELAESSTVQARFEQRKVSSLFADEVVRTGQLRLRRSDGRLIWSYDGGVEVLMAGGRFYPAGKSKEDLGPAAMGWSLPGAQRTGRIMEALFSLDPDVLGEFFSGEATGEGTWTLRPTGRAAAAIFSSVELTIGGDPKALRRIAMHEATGDRTVVVFTDLTLGEPLPDDLFQTPAERSAAGR